MLSSKRGAEQAHNKSRDYRTVLVRYGVAKLKVPPFRTTVPYGFVRTGKVRYQTVPIGIIVERGY